MPLLSRHLPSIVPDTEGFRKLRGQTQKICDALKIRFHRTDLEWAGLVQLPGSDELNFEL
jgi:hypothetical protein